MVGGDGWWYASYCESHMKRYREEVLDWTMSLLVRVFFLSLEIFFRVYSVFAFFHDVLIGVREFFHPSLYGAYDSLTKRPLLYGYEEYDYDLRFMEQVERLYPERDFFIITVPYYRHPSPEELNF